MTRTDQGFYGDGRTTRDPAQCTNGQSAGRATVQTFGTVLAVDGGATSARHGLDDLYLFAVLFDQMADVDDAAVAHVGALEAGVMRLYGVVGILGRWVRMGCARLCGGHEAIPSWSVPWGVSPPPGLPY